MRLYNKRDVNSIVIESNSINEIFSFIKNELTKRVKYFIDCGPNYKPALIEYIKQTLHNEYNVNAYISNCIKLLNKILIEKYNCKNPTGKLLYLGYYIEIGIQNPQLALSNEQKRRSPRCIEYWLQKGFSLEEAKNKVASVQSKNGYHSSKKLSLDYWLKCGYSLKEAEQHLQEYKLKIASSSTEHMKLINGYSEEDIKSIKKEKYNSRSIEKYATKYNVSIEEAEKHIKDRIQRSTRYGKENGMYGKPSPLKSGAAYSGYYKTFLFRSLPEYYFIKYNEKNNIKSAEHDFAITLPNGKTYHPDFIIDKTIYEIKADYMVNNPETIQKIKSLRETFPNYKVELLPASSIKPVSKEIILQDIENNDLRITKNKLERFNKYLKEKL